MAETKQHKVLDPRIDMDRLPRHIAVIMDGNGRWAEQHGKRHVEGHEAGARSVREIIEGCREFGIEVLTLYAFSTENWKRSKLEVEALFRLMSKYIYREIDEIDKNGIRVGHLGRFDGLPAKARKDLAYCLERTKNNTDMLCNVALNYGGRAELVDAVQRVADDVQAGSLQPDDIDEDAFARYLYSPDCAEVDLLIRTSGEMRISNFLLWQLAYSEIVVDDVYWPDFRKPHLCEAIVAYQKRDRRFGARK